MSKLNIEKLGQKHAKSCCAEVMEEHVVELATRIWWDIAYDEAKNYGMFEDEYADADADADADEYEDSDENVFVRSFVAVYKNEKKGRL